MGEHQVSLDADVAKSAKFIHHLINDIEVLDQMIEKDLIEKAPIRIGAEQEFCLLKPDSTPSRKAVELLELIDDDHFTTELGLFNLEINLDPQELNQSAFSRLEDQLKTLLLKAYHAAKTAETRILLAGILPTISSRNLELDYMTPSPRYQALNEIMKGLRGGDFNLNIAGVDELKMKHDSVLFEACNTSFQMHLQIHPNEFVADYNWSQMISGPLLSVCTNSPLLLGRELWAETRISLFQQSIDTRDSMYNIRHQEPRVTFGKDWIKNSITDLYKDDVARFKILLNKEIERSSAELLKEGQIPKLPALAVHNGSVYRWNRGCYGVGGGKPHIRIENRYIPGGPTIIDEVANMMFWVGLMKGRPDTYDDLPSKMSFKDVKSNFFKAARYGKDCLLNWMGEMYTTKELIFDVLLPIAVDGLQKIKISQSDIDKYMTIIRKRTIGRSGSEWQIDNFRLLCQEHKRDEALIMLCDAMEKMQKSDLPVHEWPDVACEERKEDDRLKLTVSQIMSTELYTVRENDIADLVTNIMFWKEIHHVPVENERNELVGLLTWSNMKEHLNDQDEHIIVKDIMQANLFTISKNESVVAAQAIMKKNGIGCLPVVKDNQLIGILTKNDL